MKVKGQVVSYTLVGKKITGPNIQAKINNSIKRSTLKLSQLKWARGWCRVHSEIIGEGG